MMNKILLVILIMVFLSGMLLHPFQGIVTVKIIHKLSSLLLIIGVVVHVLQHRNGKNRKGME